MVAMHHLYFGAVDPPTWCPWPIAAELQAMLRATGDYTGPQHWRFDGGHTHRPAARCRPRKFEERWTTVADAIDGWR
ncbi:MAG: hypothetical protein R2854_28280 [Caldilineaceae bacterium]